MLIEGECEGPWTHAGPLEAWSLTTTILSIAQTIPGARAPGPSRTRKRGPKTNYVRTDEVERQVIRHRFLDPDASVDIIAQKLRQAGFRRQHSECGTDRGKVWPAKKKL